MDLTLIEKDLINSLNEAHEKEKNLLLYINASYAMQVISTNMVLDSKKNKPIEQKYKPDLEKLFSFTNQLKENDKDIHDYQNELMFKNYYQLLEEYLNDIFKKLFHHFPSFLKSEKFNLDFDLVFEQNNLELIRRKIIESRTKKYIQSNNILEVLKKFKTIFGLKIIFEKNDLDSLYIASKIRNILTHGNGKINEIFLEDLKLYNIPTDYKSGDSILPHLEEELEKLENVLDRVINIINDQLIKSLNQLSQYSRTI